VGLYIHVPFCVRRCGYCSFNTAPLEDDGRMDRYLAALEREIGLLGSAPWGRAISVATIFLGGGTPSLLPADRLAALLERVRSQVRVEADVEVTVECNPESVSRPKLEGYREAGVNRVSLGVQTLDDALLERLGRLHRREGARSAFEAAREAGLASVSVDLMYGLPGRDVEGWRRDVETVLGWAPEHLSAYGLTLDAGSLWSAAGVPDLPAEATVVAQYWALAGVARDRGYEHYEISNYARPGFRSRHNLTYWRAGEYLACGPGACGFLGDVRYENARALPRYWSALEEGHLPVEAHERLTPRQQRAERLILGLRTSDGVPVTWLADHVAGDAARERRIAAWRDRGLLRDAGGRVRLTEAGYLLSDALFVDLV
jgi:oxygen-independent coproporphyrinogen-3 oxidase